MNFIDRIFRIYRKTTKQRLTLDLFINKNYKYLLGAAVNITHNTDEAQELLHSTLEIVYTNKPKDLKQSLCTEKDAQRFFCRLMTNSFRWTGGKFRKSMKNKLETPIQGFDKQIETEDEDCNPILNFHDDSWKRIYIDAENTNEKSKDHLWDIIQQGLPQEQFIKIMMLPINVQELLTPQEKIVYTMHFVQGMNARSISRQVSKKIKISPWMICLFIHAIRDKLTGKNDPRWDTKWKSYKSQFKQ